MGFHALFGRENVLEILQQTLQEYYDQRYPDRRICVGYERRADAAEFFLIPRLGMIMQAKPGKELRRHFYAAYNIRNNTVKYLAAKLLVFTALHFPKLLAMKERLYVMPADVVNSKTLFSYCNRSLRIFDYEKGTTVSIQKNGFTDKFFQNQLQFRLGGSYTFVPAILDSGENWFEEDIYAGKVLARVTNPERYVRAQEQVLIYLDDLQAVSQEDTPAREYISALCGRLNRMLQCAQQQKTVKHCAYAWQYLRLLERFLETVPDTLPTVLSHRDLQGGNILVTDDRVLIIDWETQARGSRWFDAITMLYGTRYYGGIQKLKDDVQKHRLLDSIGESGSWSQKQILAIFLLEDLEFYLEDMLELPGTAGSATFDRYMVEIRQIRWDAFFDVRIAI